MSRIFIVAGEASGDGHAAALVKELLRQDPQLAFTGLGGPKMGAAGVTLLEDLTRYAVVGAVEIFKHLGTLRRIFRQACHTLETQRPDLVILVDYPGFNLRFAREAKRRGIPVIYYISPQVWAWGAGRIRTIRRVVDLMLVFFQFEEQLYHEAGVAVQWVGHPLLDSVKVTRSRTDALRQYALSTDQPLTAILPGSREQEIRTLLPILAGAAEQLAGHLRGMRFLVLQAPGIAPARYREILVRHHAGFTLVPEWDDNLLAACDLALVASGTATLECALLERPMVIVYRTHPITWWLGARLVKLPYIGLVNVVAGRRLVPECLQADATPDQITAAALSVLQSESLRRDMQAGFREIRAALGEPGAARRAAEATLTFLDTKVSTGR